MYLHLQQNPNPLLKPVLAGAVPLTAQVENQIGGLKEALQRGSGSQGCWPSLTDHASDILYAEPNLSCSGG